MSIGKIKAFLDGWLVYSGKEHHLKIIGECLEKCQRARLVLNPKKCQFMVPHDRLLGHIVCKEGLKTSRTRTTYDIQRTE